MLKALTVNNFALIDCAQVEFSEGLTILTGETGAGKSILIDALNTILGGRASVDLIRRNCEYFRVEAVFSCRQHDLHKLLEDQGIQLEDGETLIISRRLSRHGKNAILINGCHVPLFVLRQVGEMLVDMHGQHENQALLRPDYQLSVLDSFAETIKPVLETYRLLYKKWQDFYSELTASQEASRERIQRQDMLAWQTQEIASAALKAGEEEQLRQEILVLANAEKIATSLSRAYNLLSDGERGFRGITAGLAEVKREMEIAARYDRSLEEKLDIVNECLYQLQDVSIELAGYHENIDFNPTRLAHLQERMDIIYKLKKKYGETVDDILNYYVKARNELEYINSYDERIAELSKECAEIERQLAGTAQELSVLRKNAAQQLADHIKLHMNDLGMPGGAFEIKVTETPQYTANGRNEVLFLFSANRGEEPKPLAKVASGGELSRIALAVKTVSAQRDEIGTMIFDEVDSGIGGQTAQMVAEKIAFVAKNKQVLCITHSPQIACMADSHIFVEKKTEGDKTTTTVRVLDESERLLELTRMISGGEITPIAVNNAAEMFQNAQYKIKKWKKQAQA